MNEQKTSTQPIRIPVRPRASQRQFFPRCKALEHWPSGFLADHLADLSDDEARESHPDRWTYCDAELEEWHACVRLAWSRARPARR